MKSFLKFFPDVLNAVSAVESNYPTLAGASKKQTILSSIHSAAQVGESVPVAEVQTISALIDLVVGALNNSGVFTHSATAVKT